MGLMGRLNRRPFLRSRYNTPAILFAPPFRFETNSARGERVMRLCTKAVWSLSVALCLALLCVSSAGAQTVTTGDIAGTVVDGQGGVLPGAVVTATHADTGTSYEAVTGVDGRYNLLNVRVGTYTIAVTMSGFKDQKQEK